MPSGALDFRTLSESTPCLLAYTANAGEARVNTLQHCLRPAGLIVQQTNLIVTLFKGASGTLSLSGLIFADNLPQPKDFTLTVTATVTKTAMTIKELRSLP